MYSIAEGYLDYFFCRMIMNNTTMQVIPHFLKDISIPHTNVELLGYRKLFKKNTTNPKELKAES